MGSPTSCVSTLSSSGESLARNMWNPLLELLFHEQVSALSNLSSMKLTWLRSHSLVILLLMYFVTRKLFTTLHDAPSGTIACGVYLFWYGTIAALVHRRSEDHEVRAYMYSVCHRQRMCPIVVGHRSNHAKRRLWRPFLSGWDSAVS